MFVDSALLFICGCSYAKTFQIPSSPHSSPSCQLENEVPFSETRCLGMLKRHIPHSSTQNLSTTSSFVISDLCDMLNFKQGEWYPDWTFLALSFLATYGIYLWLGRRSNVSLFLGWSHSLFLYFPWFHCSSSFLLWIVSSASMWVEARSRISIIDFALFWSKKNYWYLK